MSNPRLARILDAAYVCFTRHGVRRTTMEDLAAAAGMSRPALYQYARNKDDVFRQLARRLYDEVLAEARAAADRQDLYGVLAPKLALTQRLFADSPHATELVGENARLSADLDLAFTAALTGLVADVLRHGGAADDEAAEVAALAVALTRGLEADLSDAHRPQQRLRRGLALLVGGLHARKEPP